MATRRQHKCYAVKINAGNDTNNKLPSSATI